MNDNDVWVYFSSDPSALNQQCKSFIQKRMIVKMKKNFKFLNFHPFLQACADFLKNIVEVHHDKYSLLWDKYSST